MKQYNFAVDEESRIITQDSEPIVVKGDINITSYVFTVPKIIHGIDMSEYSWRVWYTVNASNTQKRYFCPVSVVVSGDDLVITWQHDLDVAKASGSVSFSLSALESNSETGEVTTKWNSLPFTFQVKGTVGGGVYITTEAEREYISDLVAQMVEARDTVVPLAEQVAEDAETASQAKDTAVSASSSAVTANTQAQAAKEAIDAAMESFYSLGIVEEASGDPASFADGASNVPMKSVSVGIEPVQDLNGYEYPWVGGAGRNQLQLNGSGGTNNGVTFTINSNSGTVVTSGTATAQSTITVAIITLPAGSYVYTSGYGTSETMETYDTYLSSGGTVIARGNPTFSVNNNFTLSTSASVQLVVRIRSGVNTNNLTFKPMIRLASVSDDTFAPYSNICPISGWDDVKVTRCGVNYGYVGTESLTNRSVTAVCSKNTIKVSGTPSSGNNANITIGGSSQNYNAMTIGPFPAGRYKCTSRNFVGQQANDRLVFGAVYSDNTPLLSGSRISSDSGTSATGKTVTFTATKPFKIFWFINVQNGTTINCTAEVSLVKQDDAFDYSSPNYQTCPISLTSAGTVYGGTLDATTGELVVDRKMVDFDGTESWGTEVVQNVRSFYLLLSNASKMTDRKSGALYSELLSNEFVGTNVTGAGQMYVSAGGYLNCRTGDNFTDVETWKSFLASNPLKVIYPLATPLTYTLTPSQITSIFGTNHVWADCGEISCEYVADTKMYIQNLLNQ